MALGMIARTASVLTVVLLTAAVATPPAAAVTPPVVDVGALPRPAPPAPTEPTELIRRCHVRSTAAEPAGRPPLTSAELQALWQLARGGGQTVAVIDTGVARHHLLPRLLPGGDYVAAGDGTEDCDGHGTIVAGLIGAAPSGADGFAGVAPDAEILAIRQSSNVFRRSGDQSAPGVGDVDTLARAIRTAADAGATVINVSSVACAPAAKSIDDRALGAALAYAVDVKNVVIVAAAGNVGGHGVCDQQNPIGGGRPDWGAVKVVVSPSWYDDYVLTVGSIDRDGRPSAFSMAGPWVDVAAPGEHLVSLDPDGEGLIDSAPQSAESADSFESARSTPATPLSGTSYAAPVVSGIAALIRSRAPELTARQVMHRIIDTSIEPTAGWDPMVGYGAVDALAAVSSDGPGVRAAPSAPATTVAAPASNTSGDGASRAVAFVGAAACITVVAAMITLSANRLRRRGKHVVHPSGAVDAEFGSAR
jgi:membrane-anchored mycosin MYCP